jgi:hypothetical protein
MILWVVALFLLNLAVIPAVVVLVRGDEIFRLLVLYSWGIAVCYLAVRIYLFFTQLTDFHKWQSTNCA